MCRPWHKGSGLIVPSRLLVVRHVYHGRRIESTLWPIQDKRPPFNRVIVVSHQNSFELPLQPDPQAIETVTSNYIDLGSLDVHSRRELEVLILLGHVLSVPRTTAVLHRSPKTIQRHKSSISEKLGLRGQAELVQIVTELGLELNDAKLKGLRNGRTRLRRASLGVKSGQYCTCGLDSVTVTFA